MKSLVVLLISTSAIAQTHIYSPKEIVTECYRQMELSICMAMPTSASINQQSTILISGVGRVSYQAYKDYVDLNNPSDPKSKKMCDLALHHMIFAPGSDHDKIARSLWTPK